MRDADRLKLIAGPYTPPKVRKGDKLFCEIRGTVRVGGYTDALIPWPRLLKTGKSCLVVCGNLVRAIKVESEIAIAHHWGVSVTTVWAWRKALGVGRITEGTERLYREYQPDKLDPWVSAVGRERAVQPAVIERMRQGKIGKPAHPNTAKALATAARRKRRRKAHGDAIGRALHLRHERHFAAHQPPNWAHLVDMARTHRQAAPAPSRGQQWHPAEDALLGLAPDSIVASIVERSKAAVSQRRQSLGIPAYRPKD